MSLTSHLTEYERSYSPSVPYKTAKLYHSAPFSFVCCGVKWLATNLMPTPKSCFVYNTTLCFITTGCSSNPGRKTNRTCTVLLLIAGDVVDSWLSEEETGQREVEIAGTSTFQIAATNARFVFCYFVEMTVIANCVKATERKMNQ